MNIFELKTIPNEIKASCVFRELFEKNILSEVDIFFCSHYLKDLKNVHENTFFFLALVSFFIRQGHLCFSLEQTFFPKECSHFFEKFSLGALSLPKEIKEQLFVVHNNLWYPRRYFEEEQVLLNNISRIYQKTPYLIFKEPLKISSSLTKKQAIILKKICNLSLSLICGGPGTGKTFLAIEFIDLFFNEFPNSIIKILAPTGKVVSNFKEKINEKNFPNLRIQTIHSFINEIKNNDVCAADLILVDEGSMIDAIIFSKLLSHTKDYSRLIILGDPNQLPPIGIGNIFKDLTQSLSSNTFILSKTLRTNVTKIKKISKKILEEEIFPYKNLLDFESMCKYLAQEYLSLLEENNNFLTMCVLTPLRQGIWGSLNLNKYIHEELKKINNQLKIPIIITKNIPHLNIWNGETGFFFQNKNYIVLNKQKQPLNLVHKYFSYNYVMSIHKSQGSEYDLVHILLPPNTEFLSKEILYTAVTRAKKNIEIWSEENIIKKSLENSFSKLSGVKDLLKDLLIVKNNINNTKNRSQ